MKPFLKKLMIGSIIGCSLFEASAQGRRGARAGSPPDLAPPQAGTYTTLSGTVAQLNYNREAEVSGFLLDKNTLVELPRRAAAVAGATLHQGDSVQIAGMLETAPTGFKMLRAQSLQDRTSGKNFAEPQPGAAAPYSGSGRIQQLNYGPGGTVNGFLLDNGVMANVPGFNANNPSSIKVGATVTVAGFARTTMGSRTAVDVQTLTANGQTVTMAVARPEAPPRPARGPRSLAPPPPPNGPAPPNTPGPDRVADQPPPPPPPPAPLPL